VSGSWSLVSTPGLRTGSDSGFAAVTAHPRRRLVGCWCDGLVDRELQDVDRVPPITVHAPIKYSRYRNSEVRHLTAEALVLGPTVRFRDLENAGSVPVSITHGREGLSRLETSDIVLATTAGGEIRRCDPGRTADSCGQDPHSQRHRPWP
jgi:hypothetical protein